MMASSWREGVPIKNWNRTQLEKNLLSFWSCKWVVPNRNGLGTVPKVWGAVTIFFGRVNGVSVLECAGNSFEPP